MKETVTVTVRTDSKGVTGRGRGSLSPVLSGFVPIAGGHGVANHDPGENGVEKEVIPVLHTHTQRDT